MNILLVYPKYPDTYWSFKHALRFISKKAAVPPLGLITVSAMLPKGWNKKLVDLNICDLEEKDLHWADFVFISAMYVQKESVARILTRCQLAKRKIIAGGPLFTQEHQNYPEIDHFILKEAEITLPGFLNDLANGLPLQRIYTTDAYADMEVSPVPDFHLLRLNDYAFVNLQVSRGCPFGCDFCEITTLLGHRVRMKSTAQVLNELETLYRLNWRGPVSIVDDNFIGNQKTVINNLLPAMTSWMKQHSYPFSFSAQTSIDLADDDVLLGNMRSAGFTSTFIGIETPVEEALHSCHKIQNRNRDMIQNIKTIQQSGIQVSGGFIVGFDTDNPGIFQTQINFIQQSGIVSAMVGLLNAPKNTKLYKRLEKENRLTEEPTGSNTDFTMNFVPVMDRQLLLNGYREIIQGIYAIKPYYARVREFLSHYNRNTEIRPRIAFSRLMAFFKSILIIGIINQGRSEYWKLLAWTLRKKPGMLVEAVTFTVFGYHFRTVYGLRNSRSSQSN